MFLILWSILVLIKNVTPKRGTSVPIKEETEEKVNKRECKNVRIIIVGTFLHSRQEYYQKINFYTFKNCANIRNFCN